jgi:pyrimidine-nucleoside phosphorylase
MNPSQIIRKKREGKPLTRRQIEGFVKGHMSGKVADYQVSAFAMAVFFQGMTPGETAALTDALMHSGDRIAPSQFKRFASDKHSTGGVGDTVSLILAPLVASLGVAVPMVSGRGLGHTGGTLDKLESIPGFRTDLSLDDFVRITNRLGSCLIGQTDRMCPADKKWYSLRDVTATVESIPLIVASIMSKKMAEGISGLVLDVKVGSGAFMQTRDDARTLAQAMVDTGARMGRKTCALITDMNQPLAKTAGNALEAAEAIGILRNEVFGPLRDLSVELSAYMLVQGGAYKTLASAKKGCERNLANGKALAKFAKMIEAQHGDPRVCDDLAILPKASIKMPYTATRAGVVQKIDTMSLGLAANAVGVGRTRVTDPVDPAVGLEFHVRLGDHVRKGQKLLTVHANDKKKSASAKALLSKCFTIGDESVEPPKLIKEVVE